MFDRSPSATSAPGSTAGVLAHRRALAGQRRFLRLERRRMNDPTVGRNDVARLHLHDVTGNHIGSRHQRERAVPHHLRLRNLQVRQRSHTRPRLQLLTRTEHNVEEDQQRHDDPRRNLADREAHHHDRNQHDVHRIAELTERDRPHRRRLLARDLVRPELLQPIRRFPGAQTRSRIRPQRRRHVRGIAGEGWRRCRAPRSDPRRLGQHPRSPRAPPHRLRTVRVGSYGARMRRSVGRHAS